MNPNLFMKKLLFCLSFLIVTFFANAQETTFKPFKFDIALGYGVPGGSGSKAGLIFALEPKYALNHNLTFGLRWEGAVMVRATMYANGEAVKGDAKASGSYLLTGDYYFNTNSFRPFAGIGAGLYRNAAVNLESDNMEADMQTSSNFGFAPRVGFEYGHFRTAIEYNVAGKSGTINNNYLGIKLGFFIGGGRY
jgi:outer membrane protein X